MLDGVVILENSTPCSKVDVENASYVWTMPIIGNSLLIYV